jgi:hypothetical protein
MVDVHRVAQRDQQIDIEEVSGQVPSSRN